MRTDQRPRQSGMRKLFSSNIVAVLLCSGSIGAASPRVTSAFDEDWRFHLGDAQRAEQPAFVDLNWRRLDLPHDWSAEQNFSPTNASGTGFLPGGIGWYRKSFTLPEDARGKRCAIEFDGVYRNSDVWINGKHLGHRPYGYIGFQYDLTPYLRFGSDDNVIAVRVQRENVADSRWYTGTGIYRHVRLTQTDPVHIAPWGVFVTTPQIRADSADVHTAVDLVNSLDKSIVLRIVTQVLDARETILSEAEEERTLSAGESFTLSTWQRMERPQLWSPGTPTLYALVTRLFSGDELLDEVRTSFGVRQFHFDPDEGFFLNGSNQLLKGVCMHHDAGVVGTAVPLEVLERRLRLLKDLGANAVRCSHNPMAPELYTLCDQLGFLVMDEAFDEWEIGKRKWVTGRNNGTAGRFGYAEAFEKWAERDLADMVRQHRNHPSIILWSLGNEIDYPTDPYVHPESRIDPDFAGFPTDGMPSVTRLSVVAPNLIATVKRHDPTRPVTMALANVAAANGIGLADMLDVAGYNYQEKKYEDDHLSFPHRVIYGSENGKRAQSWQVVRDRDYISGLFLWAGFDFLGEANTWPSHGSTAGVFDRCGFPKSIALQFEALWKEEPLVRLVTSYRPPRDGSGRSRSRTFAHWTWNAAPGDSVAVTAFSNCEAVELELNGRSLGRRVVDDNATAQWYVPYEKGDLVAIGFADDREQARHRLRTAQFPTRLAGSMDRESLPRGGVAHVIIQTADPNGVVFPHLDSPVTVTVTGGGTLLGLDNGRQDDPTPLRSAKRIPEQGRLLALVQAGKSKGPITFKASAEGLDPLELRIRVE